MAQGGPSMAAGVREGDVLAGKYRVERVLGAGGMGVVVAAHHIHLDEKVALKFLLPEALGDSNAVARFAREARNAVKIKSEHVARVFDVGTLETGAPYMVMEYLNGVDLAGWLRQRGPLPFEEAIDFVLQAGEAIAEAHALGIVHRDLKPANLFCIRSADGRPTVKVLDFGISKMTGVSASSPHMSLTKTASLMGSPFYMSPEQMEATRDVDARADIWALGVILHELLTGTVPFDGETVPEVAVKVGTRAPPPLRDFRPDAPEGLQAVIFRCLEKDRQRRYPDVSELAVALLPFGSGRSRPSVEKITAIIEGSGSRPRGCRCRRLRDRVRRGLQRPSLRWDERRLGPKAANPGWGSSSPSGSWRWLARSPPFDSRVEARVRPVQRTQWVQPSSPPSPTPASRQRWTRPG